MSEPSQNNSLSELIKLGLIRDIVNVLGSLSKALWVFAVVVFLNLATQVIILIIAKT